MKITNAIILKTIALVVLGGMPACQTAAPATNTANVPANTTRAETSPANKAAAPETTDKEADKPSNGALDTPTAAYKAAYAARQKKDVASLKRTLSKDALEFFEIMTEPGKSIDDTLLKLTETPQAATDESRNEKINGDSATLEYPDAEGKWKKMDFVKEGSDWKLTFPKPDSKDGKK
jgi:predicted lipid-binding transport protein (Tim44 family)